jgi:hypothetical protein
MIGFALKSVDSSLKLYVQNLQRGLSVSPIDERIFLSLLDRAS